MAESAVESADGHLPYALMVPGSHRAGPGDPGGALYGWTEYGRPTGSTRGWPTSCRFYITLPYASLRASPAVPSWPTREPSTRGVQAEPLVAMCRRQPTPEALKVDHEAHEARGRHRGSEGTTLSALLLAPLAAPC
jgi:hypothetical protein